MGFWEKVLGFRDFIKQEEIKEEIKKSKYFSLQEDLEKVKSLIFFETKTQKTWLLASDKRLYCILDDISKETTKINWSELKENIYRDNNLLIDLTFHEYKERTGKVNFGKNHKGWLYTKRLFKNETDFRERFENLVK